MRSAVLGARRRGFSLVELLVVIALIAILAAAGGVVSSNYLVRRRVEQYAVLIVQDMRAAQAEATFSRTPTAVTFSAAGGDYVLTGSGATKTRRLSGGVSLRTVQFGEAPPVVATTEGTWSVGFSAYGSPQVSDHNGVIQLGALRMSIQGASAPRATIELSPVLGRATISWSST